MNDTDIMIQTKLEELYSNLSSEEKFNKMLSMCQTVREIILSQMPSELSDLERRKKLFETYYSRDFSEEDFNRLKKRLFQEQLT